MKPPKPAPEESHITPQRWRERFTTYTGDMIRVDPATLEPMKKPVPEIKAEPAPRGKVTGPAT